MTKNTFAFILFSSSLLFSCGNSEKETEETNMPADTAVVDSTENEETDPIASIHPISDWARRNPTHDYFYSQHVDELVNGKAKYEPNEDEMMDYTHDHLNKAEMNQLTVRELLYYCLKYPCSFSQICAADEFQDSTSTPKIPGYLPFSFSGEVRSEWQDQALEKRRDSVIIVMNNYIAQHPTQIDPEYLVLLLEMKAVESVPTMSKVASLENHVYSFLLALMMETKYAPFQQTGMYQRLYGDDAWRYGNRIEATEENIDSVKTQAMQMHKAYRKK